MSRRSTFTESNNLMPAGNDLFLAIWADDYKTVKRLLESRAVSEIQIDRALCSAVHADSAILRLLLRWGADVSFDDYKALAIAVRHNYAEAVLILLDCGARPESLHLSTILEISRRESLPLLRMLLESGLDLPEDDREFVDLLVQLHGENKFFTRDLPANLTLDNRRRDLICDAINGCVIRGELAKIRSLVLHFKDKPPILSVILACLKRNGNQAAPNVEEIRKLIHELLDGA